MHAKEVKKSTQENGQKKDFYLIVYNEIKNGKSPNDICFNYNVSKQKLNYYIKILKEENYIKKVGYATWEILRDFNYKKVKRSKKKITRLGKVFIPLSETKCLNTKTLRRILKKLNLNKCLLCDSHIYEIHHVKPISQGGENKLKNLIPLCPNHHKLIHNYGISEYMKKKIRNYFNYLKDNVVKEKNIRGHGFVFKFRLPNLNNWNKRRFYMDKKEINYKILHLLGGAERIILNDKKIWLTTKNIIIFCKDSYISETAKESKENAIESMLKIISKLENIFNVSFKIKGRYIFKATRQHFARIKDELAKEYNINGEKLHVYNSKGLWFVIDNSYNLDESETVHPITAQKDMDNSIVPFFNSLKNHQGFTVDFILHAFSVQNDYISKITENQAIFDANMQSHLQVLKDLGNAVNELREVIKNDSRRSSMHRNSKDI